VLVIRCREGEALTIGSDIEVVLLEIAGGRAKFGITAPREIRVCRRAAELTRQQNLAASSVDAPAVAELVRYCIGSQNASGKPPTAPVSAVCAGNAKNNEKLPKSAEE
jgi:carbon storage regulator